jgi:hypothetical protein
MQAYLWSVTESLRIAASAETPSTIPAGEDAQPAGDRVIRRVEVTFEHEVSTFEFPAGLPGAVHCPRCGLDLTQPFRVDRVSGGAK